MTKYGLPQWISSKEFTCNTGDAGWTPGWEDLLEKAWQPSPIFLPGEFHGQSSPAGYSLWGRKASETTERLSPA